ncbi:uncharacterized protein V1516DRAFT_681753 [Lipomyces oligophaga]|uniref:uncharacterized protein n=1 Tax=Lipomyces oligophaga TaxID=45792 RepID=UPI0034CFFAE7
MERADDFWRLSTDLQCVSYFISNLPHIERSNCAALYGFGVLTVVFTVALRPFESSPNSTDYEHIIQVFYLIREPIIYYCYPANILLQAMLAQR